MPDHNRGYVSRCTYVNDIVQDDTYVCEGDTYNYAILKTNENKFLFLLYEKEDGIIVSTIYTDKFYNSEDVLELEIGTPLADVYEKFNIYENSNTDTADELYLYSKDGGYYIIEIDDKSNVSNIEKIDDEYDFMGLLKESDDFDISDLFYQ